MIIVLENKLSANTAFTQRQKEGFGSIINGQNKRKINHDFRKNPTDIEPYFTKSEDIIISKDHIFRMHDAGTDDIGEVVVKKDYNNKIRISGMKEFTKMEQRKLVNSVLHPYFKQKKIKKIDSWADGYKMIVPFEKANFFLGIDFAHKVPGIYLQISIFTVEDLIIEVEYPKRDFSNYRLQKDYSYTLNLGYFVDSNINQRNFHSDDDYFAFAQDVINYLKNEVPQLISYCTYLPNILKEMDKLDSEGRYWN